MKAQPVPLNEELLAAAKSGDTARAGDLLAQGADANAADGVGRTALMFAAASVSGPDLVRLLLASGADVNASDVSGRTVLGHATMNGSLETVQALLPANPALEAKESGGVTATMIAASVHRPEKLSLLVAKGGDVNAHDDDGKTVLMWAVDPQFHRQSSTAEATTILLEHGARHSDTDQFGRTALMWALSDRDFRTATIEILVKGGADVNARDKNGKTPLMFAAAAAADLLGADMRVFDVLIQAGADVNAVDNTGKTAREWADGMEDVLQALQKAATK